ncbi:MAG: helix-turn-helix domain-containing protein [Bacteroidota bacterium]
MKVLQLEQFESKRLLLLFRGIEDKIERLETQFQPVEPLQYLTRRQVAEMLSISLVTVNDWRKKGILKAYKIGNRVYFKRHEVEAALVEIKSR